MLYLHVGMHKTGTTYMQHVVFPRLRGITYLRRQNLDQFLLLDPSRTYLASNERLAGRFWATRPEIEATVARLAEMFPDARVLMSFRPQADWVVSAWKEFVDQGGTLRFEEFFDFERDTGLLKREQLLYRWRLELLAKHFGQPPFVFFLREIHRDLAGLLHDLTRFLGASAPPAGEIPREARNPGLRYHPARLRRWLNRWSRSDLNPEGRFRLENRLTRALRLDPRRLARYWLAFLPDRDFLTPEARARIQHHYHEDWAYVEACARQRTSLPGAA